MSVNVVLYLLRLLPIRTSTRDNSVEIEEEWSGWLHPLPSRGVYSVLVGLILICFVITSIQNKLKGKNGEANYHVDMRSLVDGLWHHIGGTKLIHCCPLRVAGLQSLAFNSLKFEDDFSDASFGSLCEKVSAAENELCALKNALELALRSSKDLQESLEEAEKDKGEFVDRFQVEKRKRLSEMEALGQDISLLRQQLHSLKRERDEVKSKCEGLEVEARRAGEMLSMRQEIQGRLDEALAVVALLRRAVGDLEAERRDALVSLRAASLHNDSVANSVLDCGDAEEHAEDKNRFYIRDWSSDSYFESPSVVLDCSAYRADQYDEEGLYSEEESEDEMEQPDGEQLLKIEPVQLELTNTEAFKMFVQSNFGSFETT